MLSGGLDLEECRIPGGTLLSGRPRKLPGRRGATVNRLRERQNIIFAGIETKPL